MPRVAQVDWWLYYRLSPAIVACRRYTSVFVDLWGPKPDVSLWRGLAAPIVDNYLTR